MTTYRIVWEIDVEAEDPREAAGIALEIQRDPTSTALYFIVVDSDDREHEVDLYIPLG